MITADDLHRARIEQLARLGGIGLPRPHEPEDALLLCLLGALQGSRAYWHERAERWAYGEPLQEREVSL